MNPSRPVAVVVALALGLSLTACITTNVDAPLEPSPAIDAAEVAEPSTVELVEPEPTPTMEQSPNVDDSAALSDLGGMMGALHSYMNTQSRDDCEYIGALASQMQGSTPWESYRGTFEEIRSKGSLIWNLCSVDLQDADALLAAKIIRPKVTEILDARNYLGASTWSHDR